MPESVGSEVFLPLARLILTVYNAPIPTLHPFYKYELCDSTTELLQSFSLHFLHRLFSVNQMFVSYFAVSLYQAISSPDSESVVRRGSAGSVKTIFLTGRSYLRDHVESR